MRFALLGLVLLSACGSAPPEQPATDLLVYGATPSGVAAAVNGAREGLSVLLVQPDGHIGGLASGGLSNTDFKSFEALGGTFREFMQGVEDHYKAAHGPDSQQVIDSVLGGYYEPGVARAVFEKMLAEAGVEVLLNHRVLQTQATAAQGPRRIESADFAKPDGGLAHLRARFFIDATYEGDLIAASGVPTRVGCEAKSEYGEPLAFDEANNYVQTYNFRVCLTEDPANRMPIEKPADYDRSRYAPILGYIAEGSLKSLSQLGDPRAYVLKVRRIPNAKADFNDNFHTPISLSIENVNHPWPTGGPQVRQEIFDHYKSYSLGLFWFLANDEELPADWREEMSRWGLPRDEYADSGHWTPALYVREGRRMVGRRVFTQNDVAQAPGDARAVLQPDSVAIGDYSLNCHGVWAPSPTEPQIGHFGVSIPPFQVPYGVMVPPEVENLLAPVPVSASHVGFSAIRMEPVWTALGQASGLGAAQALRQGLAAANVDVTALQLRLHELGAMTIYASDLAAERTIPRPAWDPAGGAFQARVQQPGEASDLFRAAQFLGTKGFFHGLTAADAPAEPESQGRSTGQWGLRRPRHQVEPDRPLDPALAARWRELARTALGVEVDDLGSSTRGEALVAIFHAWLAQRRP
ncbi:MAG: FAD-dependent oxidoreductase [Acidobacteria bacterium]|nr:FAD-dependent oxidoreductase [Acidobacteriota bacterium]